MSAGIGSFGDVDQQEIRPCGSDRQSREGESPRGVPLGVQREPRLREAGQAVELLPPQCLNSGDERPEVPRLDLDEHEPAAVMTNEIDLAISSPGIALHHPPAPLEERALR